MSVLIDADAYFHALRSAILRAKHHVFIVGWDVDSRTRLGTGTRGRSEVDGLPIELLPFLRAALRRNPELQVYILAWDFSMIYALEREWMPSWVFSHAHPRLHYVLDHAHVVGASHHQKLVVIDDQLAFNGGIDLTIRRWDRQAHAKRDPARVDPDGEHYPPIHDVQLCLDGPAAHALGELARERWRRAQASRVLLPVKPGPAAISDDADSGSRRELWPDGVTPEFTHLPVALARTGSGTIEQPEAILEIVQQTCRAFETAERYIYIENQYFTASIVARALIRCLEKPQGPEVTLVLPQLESGWLEQSSMGILRRHVLARLRKADRHGRLHIYYPKLPHTSHGLSIHGKLMIADDCVLKVGSANLSNRSLGLDTETDVTIDARLSRGAERERTVDGVRRVLARLLGEHLDLDPRVCATKLAEAGSVVRLIESQRGRERCLEPLPESLPDPAFDFSVGDWVFDPERPMAGETFIAGFFPTHVRRPWLRSTVASVALFVPVLIMAYLLADPPAQLASWLAQPGRLPLLWAGYTLSASLFMPISVLLGAVCVLFDAPQALGFALSGALVSACLSHVVGRQFRHLTLRFVRAPRAHQLQNSARRRAFRATVVARLLPVGNFTASNLLSGALAVPFWRYLLGNLAGLSFGIGTLLLFSKRALAAFSEPTALNVALCCGAGALMIALCYTVARAFARPKAVQR
ncbi:MAG: phospholipase D-like domain-containing protein [Polyangiales bacterium]